MTRFSKLKHQVKSNQYYIFWAAATVAVVIGQIYVGIGYRQMSIELRNLIQTSTNQKEDLF